MASIIIGTGTQQGIFLLLGKKTTVIGRDEALQLQLEDERVSRKHCQFRFDPADNQYRVLDMQSTNGTYVNGKRVPGETILSDGDEVQVGDTKVVFALEDPTDKVSAMAVFKKVGERRRSTLIR
jgi:pSer/pThr/pTyr-binding forkhead associated (FHA) protein